MTASLFNDIKQNDIVGTYEDKVEEMDSDKSLEDELKKAKKYNEVLYNNQNGIVDKTDILTEDNYKNIYDITKTGIMGSLEIPKIDLRLPIYHGTEDIVLSEGLGHMKESCFPIGGYNTKSVITGHRGLADSNLFLRLDEIETDDIFYIKTGKYELAYKVISIDVVEPDNDDVLRIEDGRDLVSLVTCTPYGINSHRLIVTGERCFEEVTKKEVAVVTKKMPSFRRIVMNSMPFVLLIAAVLKIVIRKRRDEYKK